MVPVMKNMSRFAQLWPLSPSLQWNMVNPSICTNLFGLRHFSSTVFLVISRLQVLLFLRNTCHASVPLLCSGRTSICLALCHYHDSVLVYTGRELGFVFYNTEQNIHYLTSALYCQALLMMPLPFQLFL